MKSKSLLLLLLLCVVGMTNVKGQTPPYRQYADNGILLDFQRIDNVDFRAFLLYNLSQDDQFVLIPNEESGQFSISSDDETSALDFYAAFETFYQNAYTDFGLLSKTDIGDRLPVWKSQVAPQHFTSIMMDITLRSTRSDNEHCIDAIPICLSDDSEYETASTTQTADDLETYPIDDGCIGSSYNPSWYYLKIGDPGQLVIHMEGHDPDTPTTPRDIDFCMWGPYTEEQLSSGYACANLTSGKIIDCSYSYSYSEDIYMGYLEDEHVHINPGHGTVNYHEPQTGEIYILMTTNFSRQPCVISFEQSSGSGTSDCSFLPLVATNDGPYCVGETIHLYAPGIYGASYSWTGPNNYRSRYQNPNRPNCTMAMAGTYTCTITCNGQSSTVETEVVIYPNPTASFTATTVPLGAPTQFTSTSTPSEGNTISTCEWNFGDGRTGSGMTTSHTYGHPGTYQVTLVVSDGYCSDEITQTVTVNENTTGNIYFADANVKALCVAHWDTNRDGELSFAEAAAVTDLGNVFMNNTTITSFDEMQFFTGLSSIGNNAFFGCTALTSIEFPNSITAIGNFAFYNCESLACSLTIPNSVTTIGEYAFTDCGFIGTLSLSNSLTTIGDFAFDSCEGFTGTLLIPSGVTTIGERAFSYCEGFSNLILESFGSSLTTIGDWAFAFCSGMMGSLAIPDAVTTIGNMAFGYCNFNDGTLSLGNSVTSIGQGAFRNCGFSGTLNIPNSVTTIGESAFEDCTGFTGSLTIPSMVTSIGQSAFKNCSGFTRVNYQAINCADVTVEDKPFEGCGGTLSIGNQVERIPAYMFYYCRNFTGSLTIPSSVTSIGQSAFQNCVGFNGSLTIPNSVTTIEQEAFRSCIGFTGSLTIGNSVTTIGNSAFWGCTGFRGSLTLGSSLTTIGSQAFYYCNGFTGSLSIPNSVTTIGTDAFNSCSGFTGTLTIGYFVTNINTRAFKDCNNLSAMVVFSETPPTLGSTVFQNVPTTIPVTVPCGTVSTYQSASGWSAFTNYLEDYCDPLIYSINDDGVSVTVTGHVDGNAATGTLIIPETKTINGVTYAVTAIGESAFQDCSGLTGSLTIPNSVTAIGASAFENCPGLTGSLTIPNSVTSIGEAAFFYCTGFTGTLTLSSNLTTISAWAFENTRFTGSLIIPNSVTAIGFCAFYHCIGFTGSLTIPSSVTTIDYSAFRYCTGFNGSLTLPNSVTTIGDYAFEGCSGFTGTLTIGTGVTLMGESAFKDCSGFTQVYYGAINCADVTTEDKPFENCGGTLTIGNSVARIPAYMFYQCTGFTGSLTIPYAVTSIGKSAFDGCTGFTGSLSMPTSVTSIGNYAFYGCTGFTGSLSIGSSVTSIGAWAFYNTNFTGSLTLPNSVATIGDYAFYSCNGFTGSLTLGNSLTTIGPSVFGFCSGFTGDLVIPNSVTTIGNGAFYYCQGFTGSLTIGNAVTSIDNNAFGNCKNFSSITALPEISPSLGSSVFYAVPKTIPVNVPCGSLADYQSASGWSDFTNYNCLPMTVTVTVIPTAGGTVSGGGTFAYGDNCTVTANPNSNYLFMHWSKNGTVVSCNATYSFNVYQDADLEAVFLPQSSVGDIVGEGEATSVYLPSYSYYKYSLTEQIYTADELGGSFTINSISFFNAGATKTRTYDIYLKHTTKTVFGNTTDWVSASSSNKVYSGSVTMTAGMWTTIVLDTPFAYNGSSNLMLIVDDNTGDFTYSPHMSCRVYNAQGNQALRIYSDDTNYNPATPSSYTGVLMNVKNQIMFNRPEVYDIVATSANTAMGTVSGGGTYGYSDICRLKATALSGFTFVNWTDNYGTTVSTDADYSFTVTTSRSLTANFIAVDDYCNLTFDLHDSWGDGWNGNYLVVSDGNSLNYQLAVPSSEHDATFTLPFEDGSHIELSWIESNWAYECSFEVTYSNGNLVCLGRNLNYSFEYEFDMDCGEMISGWVYVGNQSSANNNFLPSYSYYCYTLSEQIYTPDEIGMVGSIKGMAFYNEGAEKTRNYSIFLTTTDKASFESSTDWVNAYSSILVFSGNVTMQSGKWTPIIFSTPFEYDGNSNLVLIVDDNTGDYTDSPHMSCRVYQTQGLQALRVYSDNTNFAPISASYNGTLQGVKNQLMLDITPAHRFVTAGNWNNASNWNCGTLPETNDMVVIDANCSLNVNADVSSLIVTEGKELTLQSGKTLTVTNNLTNTAVTGLIIRDGAQLVNASYDVAATVEKNIVAYSDASNGWYTIASPITEMAIAGSDFVTHDYDLYRFNETNLTNEEWENYKANHQDFTHFEEGYGYLYANSNSFAPAFTGILNPYGVRVDLTYTERPDDSLSGFNLMGNPFPHNIYKGAGGAINDINLASGFYTLTNEGVWQVHTYEDAILPGQGFLVKVTAPTLLYIDKNNQAASAESDGNNRGMGNLCINVAGTSGRDRAYLYFGQGNDLDKVKSIATDAPSLAIRNVNGDFAIAHCDKKSNAVELVFTTPGKGSFTMDVNVAAGDFNYLHLIDSLTGADVDLLVTPSYTFEASARDDASRFTIVYEVK